MPGPNLEPVVEALARQDYRTATKLLKPLYKSHPQDPWVQLYIARIQEGSKRPDKAEQTYRKLLKASTNGKIISQARQGLQRIATQEKAQRAQAIAQATSTADSNQLGCLVLEPMDNAAKQAVLPAFARLMQLEPYSARLLLPSRNWRFYRTGPVGLLGVYVKELADIGVPAFCVSLAELTRYEVIYTHHLDIQGDQITAQSKPESPSRDNSSQIDHNHHHQNGTRESFRFPRNAVSQCIEGALPMFELVVDTGLKQGRLGPRKASIRRETVKDYAKVLDLHLPKQKKIVRLCDRDYAYPSSESSSVDQRYAPIAQRWQRLLNQELKPSLPQTWHEHKAFTAFGETAIEQTPFLRQIKPNLRVTATATMTNRADEELWDQAFHLYSCLQLWKFLQSRS